MDSESGTRGSSIRHVPWVDDVRLSLLGPRLDRNLMITKTRSPMAIKAPAPAPAPAPTTIYNKAVQTKQTGEQGYPPDNAAVENDPGPGPGPGPGEGFRGKACTSAGGRPCPWVSKSVLGKPTRLMETAGEGVVEQGPQLGPPQSIPTCKQHASGCRTRYLKLACRRRRLPKRHRHQDSRIPAHAWGRVKLIKVEGAQVSN